MFLTLLLFLESRALCCSRSNEEWKTFLENRFSVNIPICPANFRLGPLWYQVSAARVKPLTSVRTSQTFGLLQLSRHFEHAWRHFRHTIIIIVIICYTFCARAHTHRDTHEYKSRLRKVTRPSLSTISQPSSKSRAVRLPAHRWSSCAMCIASWMLCIA